MGGGFQLRLAASVLGVVLLASEGLALVHSQHPHSFCFEHNRLEEGSRIKSPEAWAEVPEPEGRLAIASTRAHEACPLDALGVRRPPSHPQALAILLPQRIWVAPRLPVSVDSRGLSLLLVAPKGSPPAF